MLQILQISSKSQWVELNDLNGKLLWEVAKESVVKRTKNVSTPQGSQDMGKNIRVQAIQAPFSNSAPSGQFLPSYSKH